MRYQSAPVIPEERQETTRERAARQRRVRQEELRYTASDEKRWKENRERVLREREQVTLSETSRSEIIETSILKSTLLKNDQAMNALGRGELSPLSLGMKSSEVKMIQEALMALDFDLGASGADGDFGSVTNNAIKQFQRVYEPSHGTHESYQFSEVDGIVGKNTILALDEAVNENWQYIDDSMDEKWLTVPKGQFTFDNEGNDIESSPYFSRKAHVPHNPGGVVIGQSGVTIGRGLDLGNPPTGATGQSPSKLDLRELFQVAELTPELSNWLLSVEGVKKEKALESLHSSGLDEDELTLTRKQQHLMFNAVYDFMEEKTRILLTKPDVQKVYGDVGWNELPLKVKDLLIDLTYRGDNHGRSRKVFVPALVLDKGFNDYSNFRNAMNELDNIPPERMKLRLKWLDQ